MTDQWPPNVWMGVRDPQTGEKIPPTRCSLFELEYIESTEQPQQETRLQAGVHNE